MAGKVQKTLPERKQGSFELEQLVVSRVMTNPEPLQPVQVFSRQRAIVQPDAGGIEDANLLEANRRVCRILFEQCEILVGKYSDVVRKLSIVEPEVWVGEVVQSGVQRPALR